MLERVEPVAVADEELQPRDDRRKGIAIRIIVRPYSRCAGEKNAPPTASTTNEVVR